MKKVLFAIAVVLSAIGANAGVISLTTSASEGSEIKMLINAASAIQPVMIDFGDGELVPFTIDPKQEQYNRWITGTVKGANIKVQGNVTEFCCSEADLTEASIEGMNRLTKLDLSNNKIADFAFVDEAPVVTLDLSHNNIVNGTTWRANLTLDKVGETLTDLNISYNTDIVCLNMGSLTNLVYLTANDCPVLGSVFICAPEESHQTLRSINFNNCDLAHFYPVSLPQLRTLELANNNLVSGSFDTDPFILGDYPKLANLDLRGNRYITELDITACTELQQLHLSDCGLSEINISQCPELNTLAVSNNKITGLDLGNNKDLCYLYVNGNPISEINLSKLDKLVTLDISNTYVSRVDLFRCYFIKNFYARNTRLEFVDFNAQQPERMATIDLRDCPGFTPMSMAYTVKTLPVARSTQKEDLSLLLSGSHPEIADITYATSTDMHWKCDSEGDGSADYPWLATTLVNTTDTGRNKRGHLDRLYPYGGMSYDYNFDIMSTEGGEFIICQWQPEWFQTIESVSTEMRQGVPVCIYPYPADGMQFRSVTVNGKEIFSNWFIIDEPSTIKVNFEAREGKIVMGSSLGQELSFCVATTTSGASIDIDWGTGTRTTYNGIRAYRVGDVDAIGTRIDGKSAGNTVTIYGDIAAIDISCYGEIGEELFGLPNNRISAIDVAECPELKYINLYWNPVKTIDLSANPELIFFDGSYTAISSIDLSHNDKLTWLALYANGDELGDLFSQISSIDLSALPQLQYVNLKNQNLTSIDVTHNTLIEKLLLTNNHLSAIDLSKNTALQVLDLSRNNMSEIDLIGNSALVELSLDGNNLTSIDLNETPVLQNLSVANNNIHVLDVSMLSDLNRLSINGNGMTAEELNDVYYLLPERKPQASDNDPNSVKYNLLVFQGSDRSENDANGADGSLALDRKWTPSHVGTNAGSPTSYMDVKFSKGGYLVITDKEGNIYGSGSKVKKYTPLTVTPVAYEGCTYKGYHLNDEELMTDDSFYMPGIYTVVTPVFEGNGGVGDIESDAVNVYVDSSSSIVVEAPAGSVNVYSIEGRLVATLPVENGIAVVSHLSAGRYVVSVLSGGEKVNKVVILN